MKASQISPDMASDNFIEDFISSQVTGRGLDVRTEKAYRMDLQLFYEWMVGKEKTADAWRKKLVGKEETADAWKENIEAYLCYLAREKKLRASTISRKSKVFQYYASYLKAQGILPDGGDTKAGTVYEIAAGTGPSGTAPKPSADDMTLSRQEVDALFQAMEREYETLDSDFRRRVCLRDQVMLKLLFYHGIEISELLALEITDYDKGQGILTIRGKRGKQRTIRIFSVDLRRQLAHWLDQHEYFQREVPYSSRMFLSKLGRPLSMKMVILIFDKYRVMAGIQKECTPKSLKTSMQRYGQELVMEWCGEKRMEKV